MDNQDIPTDEKQKEELDLSLILTPKLFIVGICYLIYFLLVLKFAAINKPIEDSLLRRFALEVFIISEVIQGAIIIFSKIKYDAYLRTGPIIHDQNSFDRWKSIVRANNRLGAFVLGILFLISIPLGTLVGIKQGFLRLGIISVIWIFHLFLNKWLDSSQEKMTQIECTDKSVEDEFTRILENWKRQIILDIKSD